MLLEDMITAFLDYGLSQIIVCNGHSTNAPLMAQVAQAIHSKRGHGAYPVTSVGPHLTPELMRMDAARPAARSSAFGLPRTSQISGAMFGEFEVALPLDVTEVASNGGGQGDPALASADADARFSEWSIGAIADFAAHFRRRDAARPHLWPLPS